MNDCGSVESNSASDTSPSSNSLKQDGASSLEENGTSTSRSDTKLEQEITLEKKSGPDSYPLHYLVWHNNYRKLEKELTENKVRYEERMS